MPLLFNPFGGANPYGVTKLVFIMFVIAAACLYIGIYIIKKKNIEFIYNRTVWIFFTLNVLSYCLSYIFSISKIESFWGGYLRLQGIFTYIYYGIHFLICLQLFKQERFKNLFLQLTIVVAVVVGLYAWLQYFDLDFIRGDSVRLLGMRYFSTLDGPTMLGQFLIFPIVISVFNFLHEKSGIKFSYGVLTVFFCATLLITQNRASVLGLLVALVIMFSYIIYNKRYRFSFLVPYILIGIFCVGVFGIFSLMSSGSIRSLSTRLVLWQSTMPLIFDSPLFGYGLETFYQKIQTVLPKEFYLTESLKSMPDSPHNELLAVMYSRGLIGAVLYITTIVFLISIFLRNKLKTRFALISFASLVAFVVSLQFSFGLVAHNVYILAIWALLLHEFFKFKKVHLKLSNKFKYCVAFLLLLFSAGSLYVGFNFVYADVEFKKFLVNRYQNRVLAYENIISAINHAPQYLYFRDNLFLYFDNLHNADVRYLDDLDRHVADVKSITNSGFYYNFVLAQKKVFEEDFDVAEDAFGKAKLLAPNFAALWYRRGELFALYGQKEKAIMAFNYLLDIAPPYWKWEQYDAELTQKQKEIARIFRISNPHFYKVLEFLLND